METWSGRLQTLNINIIIDHEVATILYAFYFYAIAGIPIQIKHCIPTPL